MLIARPKHRGDVESTLAMNDEAGEALADGHQLDGIDVEMRRKRRDPPDRVRNILRGHRIHSGIELLRGVLVAAGADDGEFGFRHARLDRGDPYAAAMKVASQVERELPDEGLGPRV